MIQWRCDCGSWVDETFRAHIHERGPALRDKEPERVERRSNMRTRETPLGRLSLGLTGYT